MQEVELGDQLLCPLYLIEAPRVQEFLRGGDKGSNTSLNKRFLSGIAQNTFIFILRILQNHIPMMIMAKYLKESWAVFGLINNVKSSN